MTTMQLKATVHYFVLINF